MLNENRIEQDSISAASLGKNEIRSIKELIDKVSGKNIPPIDFDQDSGLADGANYPFFAIVGQYEMKLALTLAVINPNIGGVLLIGPRGIGKSTAIRGLIDLLPMNTVSQCYYGCLEEDIVQFGIDAVCPNCAKKYANHIPLSREENVHLVELPLNASLEDVIGGLDKRQLAHHRMIRKPGILAIAHKNILYIDEVNLLSNEITNAILDSASMGKYTIRRGPVSATYRSQFTLIGSMNPEEGNLRPQILDRFGLRIILQGLTDPIERTEAYKRAIEYKNNPLQFRKYFEDETWVGRQELEEARIFVKKVEIAQGIAKIGSKLIKDLKIDSLRAEITLFESAKALAAADKRTTVTMEDLKSIAPLALRMRSSQFMTDFIKQQEADDQIIKDKLNSLFEKQ
jgi:magnesium chelatase subunit I